MLLDERIGLWLLSTAEYEKHLSDLLTSLTCATLRVGDLSFRATMGHPCGLRSFDGSIKSLRRLLSILLLVVFGLPVVSPLFAMESMDQTRLPACCRRDGKHHCMASMSDRNGLRQTTRAFSTPTEKCPYCPSAVIAVHTDLLALPPAKAVFASLVSHPSGTAQTDSLRRISRDRSRQKRGPPSLLQS
jgi:hypothetical protein